MPCQRGEIWDTSARGSHETAVADSFTYTINDGNGDNATGTGHILIITNVTGVALSCDLASWPGMARVGFSGVPWYGCIIERATNVTFTGAVQSWPAQAWSDGSISVWDDFTDLGAPPSWAFYRLLYP